ncbi:MAG: hypothetical protein COC16_02960 [Lutibacter sp.]|nr:MAG: hypothetical protein COC16_02960 [Lutibacter sp.]
MINMSKPSIGFCVKLLLVLGVVFGIHITILSYLGLPLFDNYILASYSVNYVLAVAIYITLYKLRMKYLDLLGFAFMGGSFIKFAVYFIFFNSSFKENGNVSFNEAISFLSPYLTCLMIETFYLIKLLNSKDLRG